ncbi:Y-family DNA polymerase [Facklamia miroungae]|uniref:DNA polymerase V n=1 Tax=Facklamia miroungae TaxID=120956 RepID=A0A1G7TX15_9LACT|nr:Y-family DNA polymerase [Facklamia miroungae]NKZ30010.1 Y-family DNA polymerase [Facklamia miroungae]SDG39885.1 DNA polymerase V [Facklamia miroungae]
MTIIDYSREPHSDIAFIDMKSFYASVECIERGLHPLRTSLCVMSQTETSQGLILASSPLFKQVFGRKNVGRTYDLPFYVHNRRFNYQNARRDGLRTDPAYVHYIESWAKHTLFVPPRMGLYIEKNIEILKLLTQYASEEDILPYSIDEGFIDLTHVLNYFIPNPDFSRRDKLDLIASRIQLDIWRKTGVASTIGLSNANPLLAKLALDNEAKKNPTMRANWSYEDVATKVWAIPNLTDFWGIGKRTAKRLKRLGIYSIYDLAHADPERLKKEFGVIGLQLFFHANGVDESKVSEPYRPKSKGIGNSQILPRDYYQQADIELVLSEMAEQVAIRLRRAGKKARVVSIYIGYSKEVDKSPIRAQAHIDPSQQTKVLTATVIQLFRSKYDSGPVRNIGIRYAGLVEESIHYYSLFEEPERAIKEETLDKTVDKIRSRFGYVSILKANALLEGSRSIARSKLIGGHAAGGAGGLDGLE